MVGGGWAVGWKAAANAILPSLDLYPEGPSTVQEGPWSIAREKGKGKRRDGKGWTSHTRPENLIDQRQLCGRGSAEGRRVKGFVLEHAQACRPPRSGLPTTTATQRPSTGIQTA